MASLHQTESPIRSSSRGIERARQPGAAHTFRLQRLAVGGLVLIGLAVAADYSILAYRRTQNRPAFSVVLPAVPQLQELRTLTQASPNDKTLRLTLAQSYLHFQHYLSARVEFDASLALHADEWEVRTGRVRCNIALERPDLAGQDLERLIAMKPGRLETYLTLAEVQQQADDWKAAHLTLDRVPLGPDSMPRADSPTDLLTQSELLATAYAHLDDYTRALELIRHNLAVKPDRLSSRALLGTTLYAASKAVEAIPYLIDGVHAAPRNAELQYMLGKAYQTRNMPGDTDLAFACYKAAMANKGAHGPACYALAEECERRGMYNVAAFAYYRAYKLGMEGAIPLLRSGNLMLRMGNREEGWYRRGLYYETIDKPKLALVEYEKLTHTHSCCRSGYIHMARAFGAMHHPTQTLSCLQKAQKLDPMRADQLKWSLVQAYGDNRRDRDELNLLKQMVTQGGRDAREAAYQLGTLADTCGNFDEAAMWFERCVGMDPNDAIFRVQLSKILLKWRQQPDKLQSAIRNLEAAVRVAPDNRDAFYYLGMAYHYMNREEDAVLALRHAIDLGPENGENYQTLALALQKAGKREEATDAQTTFQRYVSFQQTRDTLAARCKQAPNNAVAQARMADFHVAAHEYAAACPRYARSLDLDPMNRQVRKHYAEVLGYVGRHEDQQMQLAILNGKGSEQL